MRKILFMLVVLVCLLGCDCTKKGVIMTAGKAVPTPTERFKMSCTSDLANKRFLIFRCENDEVICYVGESRDTHLQCQFKNKGE